MHAPKPGQGEDALSDLKSRLAEAEETLRALRSGEVDALVVDGESGPQVFTLKSAAEPYRLLVEQMREGALTISRQGIILYCNSAFAGIAEGTAERIVGSSVLDFISGKEFEHLSAPDGCPGREMVLTKIGGGRAAVTVSSVRLPFESLQVISAVVTDLTGHQLRLRHEAIVNSIGQPVYSLSPGLIIESWNPGAEALHGYAAHEIIGGPFQSLCPPGEYEVLEALANEVRQSGNALTRDVRLLHKNGTPFEALFCLAPLHGRDRKLSGYAAIAHDITERKAQEKTRQLLLDELNHRVKNTLAMVQSIARLTLRQSHDPDAFAESFTGRIQALAAAHDVLTASSWHGADLGSLVKEQLLFGAANDDRLTVSGPTVKLDPQTAVGLSLVLHELGTNASKYGALSVTAGRVDLAWETGVDGKVLKLRWQESGGPKVKAPSRRGFGTFIIEQSLSGLDGVADLRFEPGGLVCDMRLPLRKAKKSVHSKP